jgi:hypothetical protein
MVPDPKQQALDILSIMVLEDGKRWGETAAPFQWDNAAAILNPDGEPRQHWIELPRGARKTTDLAGIHLAALYAQAPPMARLYVGASDEEQARELVDAAYGLTERTPELAGTFKTGELEITCTRNGASVRALAVMHAEDTRAGRKVVLDRIDRWHGSKAAPVDLGEVRDTLIARAAEYRTGAVLDPHQAVLIAQEARGAGVPVHEYAFTSASVGRLALSLHQAIRNHRIALPDDEELQNELVSVRLRKNTLCVYRLDHDANGHDDQAVTLALGTYWLLDADAAPQFVIPDTPPPSPVTEETGEPLEPWSTGFAVRTSADDPWAARGRQDDEEDRPRAGAVQRAPWAI